MNTAVRPTDCALIEALTRRAQSYGGETRRVLDARIAHLLAASGATPAPAPPGAVAVMPQPTATNPLAALLAHIASHSAAASVSERSASTDQGELKSIQQFRATWTRLRIDQRLQQSRAQVPGNAGPLNTQRLLHQALTAMGDVSPEYLHRLIVHVDTVLWLEQPDLPLAPGRNAVNRSSGPVPARSSD